MPRHPRRPKALSTYRLHVDDKVIVTVDGKEFQMTVMAVYPPMSFGRAKSAGPRVTGALRPGGWGIDFDDHSTVEWRMADGRETWR